MIRFILFISNLIFVYRAQNNLKIVCYKIHGSDKVIQLYTYSWFNFVYDTLELRLVQTDTNEKKRDAQQGKATYFLERTQGYCKDYLQYGKIYPGDLESTSQVEITLHVGKNSFMIDHFKFFVGKINHYGIVYLYGMKDNFHMPIHFTHQSTHFRNFKEPLSFWKQLPQLKQDEMYCLKLLKYGFMPIDKFSLPLGVSKLNKYVTIDFNLFTKKGKTHNWKKSQKELAEIRVCNRDTPVGFNIFIQNRRQDQIIEIEINNNPGNHLRTTINLFPDSSFSLMSDRRNNWHPQYIGLISQSAKEAKMKTDKNKKIYLLFETEERIFRCLLFGKMVWATEEVSESVVLKTKSYYERSIYPSTKSHSTTKLGKNLLEKCKAESF